MNFYGITVYVAPKGHVLQVVSLPRASEEEALEEAQKFLTRQLEGTKAILCRYVSGEMGCHKPGMILTRLEKSIKRDNLK